MNQDSKCVMVLSGKGGTGKTLVAVNLAHELSVKGKKVALIDADVDSPNVAEMLGVNLDGLKVTPDKRFEPIKFGEVELFSMDALAQGRSISMRGEQYAEILRDVVDFSNWEAEYFVVDLPAGTSDEFLSLISVFGDNLVGDVIVMQPAHGSDAVRVAKLHQRNQIPVIGLIENMSGFLCEKCKEVHQIFGDPKGEKLASDYQMNYLGQIPLSMGIRKSVEDHKPFLDGIAAEPILTATELIIQAPITRPGFMDRLKGRMVGIGRDVMLRLIAEMVRFSNVGEKFKIRDLQEKYQFSGGRTINLNIIREGALKERAETRDVKISENFRVQDGKLLHVKKPEKVDIVVYTEDTGLISAFRGYEKVEEGREPYSWMDLWCDGRLEYYGLGGAQLFVSFMDDLFNALRPGIVEKYGTILDKL